MERHPSLSPTQELAYTAPMTLTQADARKIREMLATLLSDVRNVIDPSPSETVYCLNMDWFEVV